MNIGKGNSSRWLIGAAVASTVLIFVQTAAAQREQYKIEADGTVLMLKRINVTTFTYVPHAKAELRTDAAGKSLWYFKAPTGKEYTAPAPAEQPAGPQRFTPAQLSAAFAAALTRGEIPAALKVEQDRGVTVFAVKFVKNDLGLQWHGQVGMTAQEYEIVDRTLRGQGYARLFAEVYTNNERATRFVAAWRK